MKYNLLMATLLAFGTLAAPTAAKQYDPDPNAQQPDPNDPYGQDAQGQAPEQPEAENASQYQLDSARGNSQDMSTQQEPQKAKWQSL